MRKSLGSRPDRAMLRSEARDGPAPRPFEPSAESGSAALARNGDTGESQARPISSARSESRCSFCAGPHSGWLDLRHSPGRPALTGTDAGCLLGYQRPRQAPFRARLNISSCRACNGHGRRTGRHPGPCHDRIAVGHQASRARGRHVVSRRGSDSSEDASGRVLFVFGPAFDLGRPRGSGPAGRPVFAQSVGRDSTRRLPCCPGAVS